MRKLREFFSSPKNPEPSEPDNFKPEKNSSESESGAELEKEISADYLTGLDAQLDIEDQIAEDLAKTQDSHLRESLLSLRAQGEGTLKNLSSKIVNIFNSNKLVVKLRDNYVEKRSAKINRELNAGNKWVKASDYDSFLKLVQSDFWGSSSNAGDAIYKVNRALASIFDQFPGKTSEIIEIWPKLFSRDIADNVYFTAKLIAIREKEYDVLGDQEEKAAYRKNSNDFVALKCLETVHHYSEIVDEVFDHLDSIIEKYPNIKNLPDNLTEFIFKACSCKPEEIMSDSRRTDFLFNLWINNSKSLNLFRSLMAPIFADRIKTCSEEESGQILNKLLKYQDRYYNKSNIVSGGSSWLVELLPLDKKQTKLINDKIASNNDILSLNRDKLLEKDTAGKEYELLLDSACKLDNGREMIFLSNLIVNYPNENLGVGEDQVENILNSLAKYPQEENLNTNNLHRESLNIDALHGLVELMDRHHWPEKFQEKVFELNNIDGKTLNKIIAKSDDESFDWIRNNTLLNKRLQLDFHKKAQTNDLRHYFYEVMDGDKKSDNLDDLIKSYGRQGDFDFKEVENLFLSYHVDKKYIEYFIDKIDIVNIMSSRHDEGVDEDSYNWFLRSAIKHGKVNKSIMALERLLINITDPEERKGLIDNLINNAFEKIDNKESTGYHWPDNDTKDISEQFLNEVFTDFLTPEEARYLGKRMMAGALNFKNNDKATLFVLRDLSNPGKIEDIFPDESERKEYLIKFFDKLIDDTDNDRYSALMSFYFENPELLSILDAGYRLNLENKIFDLNINKNSSILLSLSTIMDDNQKNSFLECFAKNYSVAKTSDLHDFCAYLSSESRFFNNQEIYTRIYIQLLNDPNLSSYYANRLFNEEIIFSDNQIKNAFLSNFKRWPEIDGIKILELAAKSRENLDDENSRVNFSLSPEEVKEISSVAMNNRGLSPRFWKGYLASDENNPTFYLDEEIFRAGIINIGDDCKKEEASDIIEFIDSLSQSKFKFDIEDAKMIIEKSFNYNDSIERLEVFYQYNPGIMENIIAEGNYYNKALDANINYSREFNQKIFDYVFDSEFYYQLDKFLGYLKKNNNLEMVAQVKNLLATLDDKQREIGKLSLLKYDFLGVEEAKQLYKETVSSSQDNPRTQILRSINIIGSMLSNRNNIGQLENFLDKPKMEDIENLKNISDFIEKYNKENKGRSIAVMLFAREYLPGRPLEDVIERVVYNLRKYEEVIDNNSYKNTPNGCRASIGMEYEITSSTAKGYEGLTSQDSLKSDIALVSEAARIGSGMDAVHEIATRPAGNPYLMLLEMKLLHDIEYIDLNFDRSEEYRKGARGFHLTIGGEKGLSINQETNFLQNAIIAASWGGVQAGEAGHRVNGGRGVSLRNRSNNDSHNVDFFGNKSESVELRSLSIDKQETLQRAVTTAFNGAIAIQAFKECFSDSTDVLNLLESESGQKSIDEKLDYKDKKIADLARLWIELIEKVDKAVKQHNTSFVDDEMFGYLDEKGIWVEAEEFGGEYNHKRFDSIIDNIDPTLSLEEYVKTTEIDKEELFKSFSVELSDKITKINNLFLKPGTIDKETGRTVFKGDNANAMSMLKTTKLGNSDLEYYDENFLDKTVFDTAGEKRKGYYAIQGASEVMLTHAIQRALLDFNSKVEKMVN